MSDSPAPTLERSLYWGLLVMFLLLGFNVCLFLHSLILWLHTKGEARSQRRMYLIIGGLVTFLTSFCVLCNSVFMQSMWIEHRLMPGGPLGYLAENSHIWYQVLGTATAMITNFTAEGLLIWRTYLLWQSNVVVIILPCLMYLGSVSMAIVTLYQSARPAGHFFEGSTVDFGVPWSSLSATQNLILAGLIVYKLTRIRSQLVDMVPFDVLRTYTGTSALIIESALPFSIIGIPFAITFGKGSEVSPAFLFVWSVCCALAPQFIVYRVAAGKSWTRNLAIEVKSESISLNTMPLHRNPHETGSKTYAASQTGSRGEDLGKDIV